MIVDSSNYALYLSVRPSVRHMFKTFNNRFKTKHTFYRPISEYLFKDRSDREMLLDSVAYLCVLIIWVTAGQMPAGVAADKEWGFFVCVCLFLTIVY